MILTITWSFPAGLAAAKMIQLVTIKKMIDRIVLLYTLFLWCPEKVTDFGQGKVVSFYGIQILALEIIFSLIVLRIGLKLDKSPTVIILFGILQEESCQTDKFNCY